MKDLIPLDAATAATIYAQARAQYDAAVANGDDSANFHTVRSLLVAKHAAAVGVKIPAMFRNLAETEAEISRTISALTAKLNAERARVLQIQAEHSQLDEEGDSLAANLQHVTAQNEVFLSQHKAKAERLEFAMARPTEYAGTVKALAGSVADLERTIQQSQRSLELIETAVAEHKARRAAFEEMHAEDLAV